MAAPIIIDVEDESSDKENEVPEITTGHTASFEADRSGLSSIFNLFHSKCCLEGHPTRHGTPGLGSHYGKLNVLKI